MPRKLWKGAGGRSKMRSSKSEQEEEQGVGARGGAGGRSKRRSKG